MDVTFKKILNNSHTNEIISLLESISLFYPKFKDWFFLNYNDDIIHDNRIIYVALCKGDIIGVCLGKIGDAENKVCTLYIKEEFRGVLIGKNTIAEILFKKMLKEFDEKSDIFLTFNNSLENVLKRFFEKFGFEKYKTEKSIYKNNEIEHFFIKKAKKNI